MQSKIFDRVSFWALFIVIVLLPVFCLPFSNIGIETSKGILVVLGLAISLVCWAIARFTDGNIVLPKSWLALSGVGVVLATLLSALFSGNAKVSLFGDMFDVGSFWFIFAGVLFMLMCGLIFRNSKHAKVILLGTILSSALVLVFQSAHLFMPNILSLGLLPEKTSNILGSWNALALFAGFAGLMFLLVVEFFPIAKLEKILLQVFILLSILLAAVVNFPLVWILLGISSLIIFVYKVSISFQQESTEGTERKFPLISFAVVIISLIFFMSGQFVGGAISERLQISNAEVGPSLAATLTVGKGVVAKDPVFGVGPNRFAEAWALYKPSSVNVSGFWNVPFSSGSGLLPTMIITTGILGALAWLAFIFLFLFFGIKSVFSSIKNRVNWEMMAFFVLSLYLFVSLFFYSAGPVLFFLAFAFTGVFIGLATANSGSEISISFLNDHRKSFFSIMALIVLVIFSVAASFKYIERFVSVAYFGRAFTAVSAKNFTEAENTIGRALSLNTNDLYLRTYSQIYIAKFASLATKGSSLTEEEKAELETSFQQALSGAQTAANYDPQNYLNFELLGSVYQTAGSLGNKEAYPNAVLSYEKASQLNPQNPGLKLAIAGSLFAQGKTAEAKTFALEALSLKEDYIDALIMLSQISKSQGSNTEAISYAERALSYDPSNKNISQYLNSLKNSPSASTPSPVENSAN